MAIGKESSGGRLGGLDVLRGLAALFVMFGHALLSLRGTAGGAWIPTWIDQTPLIVLQQGYQSVKLFFVLSGFVLAYVLCRGDLAAQTPAFLIKRVARIWIPFAACLCAYGLIRLFVPASPSGYSTWVAGHWAQVLSWEGFANNATLVGVFKASEFNSSAWTLVHEMRISLLFPLLMLALWGRRWLVYLPVIYVLAKVGEHYAGLYTENETLTSLFYTLYYIHFFLFGMLLCQYRETIIAIVRRMSPLTITVLTAFAVMLYAGRVVQITIPYTAPLELDFLLGTGILIAVVITCTRSVLLTNAPMLWLGKVSYSLYLWHILFIVGGVRLFGKVLPAAVILPAAMLASLLMAELSYRYLEAPAIALGKKLAALQLLPDYLTRPHNAVPERVGSG